MSTTGYFIEDLEVGMSAEYVRVVKEEDIQLFAEVSGDTNPVHLDAEYAAKTMFKQRIAHGMLSASYISTVLGTILPGPGAIYLSQTLRFKAPVYIGAEVTARLTVSEINAEKRRVSLSCVCLVNDKPVVEGESMVMVPSKA